MISLKVLVLVVLAALILMAAQSCSRTPIACFNTSPPLDSIYRNHPVIFNATCSFDAGNYYWQFYNNHDSTAYTPIVTKVFKDSGTVNVYLLVTSGNNYAGVNYDITVQP